MAEVLVRSKPSYRSINLRNWLREFRRLPLLPLFLVVFVLIVPAAFAEVIAPHDSEVGVLPDRLIPPSWADAQVLRLEGGFDFSELQVYQDGDAVPEAILTTAGIPQVDGREIRESSPIGRPTGRS